MEYNVSNELKQWVSKSLKPAAPITGFKGYKYPYKPFLILSILYIYGEKSFNNEIDINRIAKPYYDYLMSEEMLTNILNMQKSKVAWEHDKWNSKLQKQVVENICKMPADKLATIKSDFYEYNKSNKTIKLNYLGDVESAMLFLENACKELISKALPDTIYSMGDINSNIYEVLDTEKNYNKIIEQIAKSAEVNQVRRDSALQYIYAKQVKERDGQVCQICGTTFGIEAAHLYHFKNLKTNLHEAYDPDNGIALCKNCHGIHNRDLMSFKDGKLHYCEFLLKDYVIVNSEHWKDPVSMTKKQIEYANRHHKDSYICASK